MKTAADILQDLGLPTSLASKGRHYTTCPSCSRDRKKKTAKCLGVTVDDDGVKVGCNHCGWTGGGKYDGKANGKQHDPVAAYYEYTDESGAVLSRKVRTVGRHFWQERPEGGGWVAGLGDCRRVLYRLPELLEALAIGRVAHIVEGEKDVDNLRKLGVVATCNHDGAAKPGQKPKWRDDYCETFRNADVIIFPDHDQPGYAHANAIAASLNGTAASVRILKLADHWPDIPEHGDVSDWLADGHTREDFDKLVEHAKPWAPGEAINERFKLARFDTITLPTAPNYLVKGIVPREGLVVIWGPPKCGKSFWTFDLFMHVALGWQYRGHKVRQGAVVYLALEGGGGFSARVEAWRRNHLNGHSGDVPFYLLTVPVDLIADHPKLIEAIKAQVDSPVAVVIDTLNRGLNGDENNPKDMGGFIRATDAIRDAFNCLAAVIHHCGIDTNRPRGHTSLAGANDVQIAVERDKADNVIATVELMKDGEAGAVIASRLQGANLGTDDDGDSITSCVIVPTDHRGPIRRQLTGDTQLAFDALVETMIDTGKLRPENSRIPKHYKACPAEAWRDMFFRLKISDRDKRDTKRRAFNRAVKTLTNLRLIGIYDDFVWLVGQAGQGGTT